jgi:hypothetical protein
MTITNGYTTEAVVNEEIGRTDVDSTRSAAIHRAINAASRQIDSHTGRRFWQDSIVVARVYEAFDTGCVEVDDISTTTGLIVKTDADGDGTFENTLTIATDFRVAPFNAAARTPVWPYTQLLISPVGNYGFPVSGGWPTVSVTAKFGWPAVPDDVAQACVIQAVSLLKAPAASMGILQVGIDGIPARVPALHPIAVTLLEPYCKARVG